MRLGTRGWRSYFATIRSICRPSLRRATALSLKRRKTLPKRYRIRQSRRVAFEQAEPRVLLTASMVFDSESGWLTISGTEEADAIAVFSENGYLRVTGAEGTDISDVTAASVTMIGVSGHGGNDVIDLSAVTAAIFTALNTIDLRGHGGDDTIIGSQLADSIHGGAGNDTLIGNAGNDTYYFWDLTDYGTDTLVEVSGGGVDALDFDYLGTSVKIGLTIGYPGFGSTQTVADSNGVFLALNLSQAAENLENIVGTPFDDIIWGNAQDNHLRGRDGNDVLVGLGNQSDYVSGGIAGSGDRLVGGFGNDELYGDAHVMPGWGTNGDFDDNGIVDAADIDILWHIVRGFGSDPGDNDTPDLNYDGYINEDDVDYLLAGLLTAGPDRRYGDANLSGGAPELSDYDAWRTGTSGWAEGDFDGSGGVPTITDYGLWSTGPATFPGLVGPHAPVGVIGSDYLAGESGDDTLEGGAGDDFLFGSYCNDVYLFAGITTLGSDRISENDGVDTLDFSGLNFGAGIALDLSTSSNDYVTIINVNGKSLALRKNAFNQIENVIGTAFADLITGNSLNNTLWGGSGDDTLIGGSGNDTLYGDEGNDNLSGGEGDDLIYGGAGNDVIDGGSGNDTLYGDEGNDNISGGDGDDLIYGGDGDDVIDGGPGDDTIDGGPGNDRIDGIEEGDTIIDEPGEGDDEFEPVPPITNDHAPVFEPIDNVTLRRKQSHAFRLIADDVETKYEDLTFSIVENKRNGIDVTSSTPFSIAFHITGGIFEFAWIDDALLPLTGEDEAVYDITVQVADDGPNQTLTDTQSFQFTIQNYNEAPPINFPRWFWWDSPGYWLEPIHAHSFYDGPEDDEDTTEQYSIDLATGAFFYADEEPEYDPDALWPDSQTRRVDITFAVVSGSLPSWATLRSDGILTVDKPIGAHGVWRVEIAAIDDGTQNDDARQTIRPFFIVASHTEQGQQQNPLFDEYFDPPVAVDDHFATGLNGYVDGYVDQSNGGGYDRNFQPANQESTLTVTSQPEHAISFVLDSDGHITYAPEQDGEGLDSASYTIHNSEYSSLEVIYHEATSNVGQITIEVGKAVRADIDIDLAYLNPDAVQERSVWHTLRDDSEDDIPGGGLPIGVNDDDDNENGVPDHLEMLGPVLGENDLIPVRLGYWLRDDAEITDFVARLRVTGSNTALRIWDSPTKDHEFLPFSVGSYTVGQEWTLDELPEGVWVEGFESAESLIELTLQIVGTSSALFTDRSLTAPSAAPVEDSNTVKFRVIDVELTAHRPVTKPFAEVAVPRKENNTPGVGIRRNGDDDNQNQQADYMDSSAIGDPNDPKYENDLIHVELVVSAPSVEGVQWVLVRDTGAINVFGEPTKQAVMLGHNTGTNEYVLSPEELTVAGTRHLYVEWQQMDTSVTTAKLRLEARTTEGIIVATEQITFHPFTSVVIVFGGNTQVPTDPPDPNHGVFQIGKDLYLNGYDVHMFPENPNTPGYNEIVSAIKNRGVTNVAIFGYSQGGGATYATAEELNANRAAIGTFIIQFTGYIDAVEYTGPLALTTRPPGSTWHLNIYQPNGAFELGGGPMPPTDPDPTQRSDEDIDATVTFNPNLDHFTIDDDPGVRARVKTRLESHVDPF